ncbi:MAG: hypothetical protein ACI9HK_004081 [Pirellulaceae bacterium]|jgi:hypothetical protein
MSMIVGGIASGDSSSTVRTATIVSTNASKSSLLLPAETKPPSDAELASPDSEHQRKI